MASLLIVGAGPTGLTAAVEPARRGLLARVVDQKSAPLALSRAVGINACSLKLLHTLKAFEADPLVEAAFGARFKEIFLDHKRTELDRSFFQVSAEQREAMVTCI